MAVNITEADTYIAANCIDIEDWTECDEAKKLRILNVASRTLTAKFSKYTIPGAAVYEFANALAIRFNDTNKLGLYGISFISVNGVISTSFKDSGGGANISRFIPQTTFDIIGTENGVKLSARQVKWTVL